MFRFLHAADLHLDSPLRGLDQYESAPVDSIRGATRRAFENLVECSIEEGVAFVVLAGDLYDGDWRDWGTGLFFTQQMAKLREAEIPVFVVEGNHDAASVITKRLRLPDNVKRFSTRAPETIHLEDLGVALHGQGFDRKAVTADLAAAYPAPGRGLFNVGILHTALDGREGHDKYAPTSAARLAAKGYDYWALGHVHQREVVSRDPWIVFPGNSQGRHARETGTKGCMLVTVENGRVQSVEERHLDVVRWVVVEVDAEEVADEDDLLGRIASSLGRVAEVADGRTVAARVVIKGRTLIHDLLRCRADAFIHQVRSAGTDAGFGRLWVEKVSLVTTPTGGPEVARQDVLGELVRELRSVRSAPGERAALREALTDLRRALPPTATSGIDGLDFETEAGLDALASDARDLLLARLKVDGVRT